MCTEMLLRILSKKRERETQREARLVDVVTIPLLLLIFTGISIRINKIDANEEGAGGEI
jgi:hypothetical protein